LSILNLFFSLLKGFCLNPSRHAPVEWRRFSLHSDGGKPESKKKANMGSIRSPSDINDQLSRAKSKVGRPQRKLTNSKTEVHTPGRVSVYCVGSSIDLNALRAHVFRRGFGSNQSWNSDDRPELTLTRKLGDIDIDDEVLHVSNAPLFYAPGDSNALNTTPSTESKDDKLFWSGPHQVSDTETVSNNPETSSLRDEDFEYLNPPAGGISSKTREMLAMNTQDIFYFEYGCVVFWGLSPREEKAAMTELNLFTVEPVSPVELEKSFDTMEFVYDRTANPQRPIRFDRMRLRSLQMEEKLALSYAMAQSSKLFVCELKVCESLEMTRYLPRELAKNGKISCSKKQLNQLIGELFVEQTEVNLFSTILDTPDFLWEDDEYVPAYQYTRSYLEVDDRVALLNSRLTVIRELLDVLTAQVADSNSTRLEWIIIWLISIEIVMGIASNPLFAGKKLVTAMLVPTAIFLFKKMDKT